MSSVVFFKKHSLVGIALPAGEKVMAGSPRITINGKRAGSVTKR